LALGTRAYDLARMNSAPERLRSITEEIFAAAQERVPVKAALLAGPAGRGDADFYSDIDLLFYVEAVPSENVLTEIREAVGGTNPIRRDEPTEQHIGEEFTLEGIRIEISFTAVSRVESGLDQLLVELDEVASPLQKIASGIAEGLPLYGQDMIERWRSRILAYPEPLRRTVIKRYWNFFPLWYYADAMAARDTELWRIEMLVDASLNLLGVLAGLNRLYYSRFELKRMHTLISKMSIAPPHLADRLESLFRLQPSAAAEELGVLVTETRALVAAELPDLELHLPFPPGARQRPWA
jgi:predicted nucleotidyltransferase